MKKNLFKTVLDGFGYEILYFVIPIAQCVAYAILEDGVLWFSTLLLESSLLYDSYTRFNIKDMLAKRKKIVLIGVIAGILFVVSFVAFVLHKNGIVIPNAMRYPYLLIAIPFFIATCDLFLVLSETTLREEVEG